MFKNIGGKIKTLAIAITSAGILVSIFLGFVLSDKDNLKLGILIAIVGSLISWISSFLLYGFGQLIDNSDIIVDFICEYYQDRDSQNNVTHEAPAFNNADNTHKQNNEKTSSSTEDYMNDDVITDMYYDEQ